MPGPVALVFASNLTLDSLACLASVWKLYPATSGGFTPSTRHGRRVVIGYFPHVQENPNAIPEGETPHNVTLMCYDPMTDMTKPGDRITVTGTLLCTSPACPADSYQQLPLQLSCTSALVCTCFEQGIMSLKVSF